MKTGLYYLPSAIINGSRLHGHGTDWRRAGRIRGGFYYVTDTGKIFKSDCHGNYLGQELGVTRQKFRGLYDALAKALKPVYPQSYEVKVEVYLTVMPKLVGASSQEAANEATDSIRQALNQANLYNDDWEISFALVSLGTAKDMKGINYITENGHGKAND